MSTTKVVCSPEPRTSRIVYVRMWPRSVAGRSIQVASQDSSAPSVEVMAPVPGSGKTSLMRWS